MRTVINPKDIHSLEELQHQFRERASELQVQLLLEEPTTQHHPFSQVSEKDSLADVEDRLVRSIKAARGYDEAR